MEECWICKRGVRCPMTAEETKALVKAVLDRITADPEVLWCKGHILKVPARFEVSREEEEATTVCTACGWFRARNTCRPQAAPYLDYVEGRFGEPASWAFWGSHY